ncbi:MAG: hypothetical protein HY744_07200 [Deltaproteobacteria bacterium]|nr:hypothetical protein [Deltaproteobacteria bacterium]
MQRIATALAAAGLLLWLGCSEEETTQPVTPDAGTAAGGAGGAGAAGGGGGGGGTGGQAGAPIDEAAIEGALKQDLGLLAGFQAGGAVTERVPRTRTLPRAAAT